MVAWRWLGWATLLMAGFSAEGCSPGGGDCEVGTVAPAFCVLVTREQSQLTKHQPGLRSGEEQHVFPLTEGLWLRLWEAGRRL